MPLTQIDMIEEAGIEQLQSTMGRLHLNEMEFDKFAEILLQRYWISQEFTHIYDAGQDRLTAEAIGSRPTLRRIIREEYPNDRGAWRTPSHREDLVTDLLNIGVSWARFTASRKSSVTASVITAAKELIYSSAEQIHPNVRLLGFLRLWGEVLTAVEYEQVFPRIQRLLAEKPSSFYQYHMAHDARTIPLAEIHKRTDAITHADKLGKKLMALIKIDPHHEESAIAAAISVSKFAIENKLAFYSQFEEFRPMPRDPLKAFPPQSTIA